MTPHRIRQIRHRLGLTQRELASRLGMSGAVAISRLEAKPGLPHHRRVTKRTAMQMRALLVEHLILEE